MQNRLTEIITNSEHPCRDDIQFLQKTVEQYPYCQPAWMLYAKALMEAGHPDFEKVANRTSAIVTDRRRFREYLKDGLKIRDEQPPACNPMQAGNPEQAGKPEQAGNPEQADNPEQTGQNNEQPVISPPKQPEHSSEHHAIIENFLRVEPRIGSIKDHVPKGELSKHSIEDHPDIVSETLADILAKQGKVARASEIYKKLSLIFPEKSSYFAKKLHNVQKENN